LDTHMYSLPPMYHNVNIVVYTNRVYITGVISLKCMIQNSKILL